MKMNIVLKKKDGKEFSIEADSDKISGVSILKYDNEYYVYFGSFGNVFQSAIFKQVCAPVEIS